MNENEITKLKEENKNLKNQLNLKENVIKELNIKIQNNRKRSLSIRA